MRTIELVVRIACDDPAAAFTLIADFARYPAIAEDVREVAVLPEDAAGRRHSEWTVNFRRGPMRWHEWESVDPDRLRIDFAQTEGDFEDFHGHWQLTPVPGGADVSFEVTYDFGIDSLAGIMDPIAERVIKRALRDVLAESFGDVTILAGGAALTDLAVPNATGAN